MKRQSLYLLAAVFALHLGCGMARCADTKPLSAATELAGPRITIAAGDTIPVGMLTPMELEGVSVADLQAGSIVVLPQGKRTNLLILQTISTPPAPVILFSSADSGTFYLIVGTVKNSRAVVAAKQFVVGQPTPDPTPGPTPNPTPTDLPAKVSGLYALILHDPLTNGRLPQTQVDVFSSKAVRDWLTANTAKDAAGTPAFRVLAPDQDLSREKDPTWVALKTAANGGGSTDPYWLLIDETRWIVESVPKTAEAAITRLEAFKGGK